MGEVYGKDQHGHIWVRKSGGGDNGCLYGLIAIGVVIIAIIVGIIYAVSSLLNSAGLATGIIKPTPTPIPNWSISLSLDSAQHSGNFATDQSRSNGMRSGATLTFNSISAPLNGTYTLYLEAVLGYGTNAPSYTLDIIVNGQTITQLPINPNTVYLGGGIVSQTKISLQQGNNTVQLKLEGADTSDTVYNYASYVNIKSIDLNNS
ncbi:MAG TPA: hypothetical protein VEP90_25180 [Methylomirabilota bacterium]|nr:hypothetical protein [Methylomirabilota bacterium]